MRAELENVPEASDCDGASLGHERTLLHRVPGVTEDDLVDLIGGEAGDLDRCIVEDQLFELDLERVEIPLALFAETIGGDPPSRLPPGQGR
jgi:hypothetical protein